MIKINLPKLTFWRGVLLAIMLAGLYTTYLRFTQGLSATTGLSDEFPWGIWIGFDILCGVALAAGGFTMSAVVYIFNVERYRPIIRPAILTAFLGYSLVIVALMFDLGRPYNVWHPLIMWNPHSVMFEVGWCVTLYTTVLALEFSPIVFERLRLERLYKIVKAMTVPLVIIGVLLSTLHQSSLGTLYLIVPHKLHPLWYTPLLPVFFWVSAIALGCTMTIFESYLSLRAFRKSLESNLLRQLGAVAAVALLVYLVIKVIDLDSRGALALAFEPTYEGRMFLAEMTLGVIAPAVMFLIPRVRRNQLGLFIGAVLTVLGFIMNRLNVSITGMDASSGVRYFPSWTEISVTASIVGAGFLLFGLAVKYLNVFPPEELAEAASVRHRPELPAVAVLHTQQRAATALSLALGIVFIIGAAALGYSGIRLRTPAQNVTSDDAQTVDTKMAAQAFQMPSDVEMERGALSPGRVRFSHAAHVARDHPSCTTCHSNEFRFLKTSAPMTGAQKMDGCGKCHNGEKAVGGRSVVGIRDKSRCDACHLPDQR